MANYFDKFEGWWDKKSKKNDPQQTAFTYDIGITPTADEFTGFDTLSSANTFSFSGPITVPQSFYNNNGHIIIGSSLGFKFSKYPQEVEERAKPVIDYLQKVLQYKV